MTDTISFGRLRVSTLLRDFVAQEVLPGLSLDESKFWTGVESILAVFQPRNAALLATRDALQAKIDAWWREHKGLAFDVAAHTAFLRDIGYLVPAPAPFRITTTQVDPEIARIPGPQLVVPVNNARYALNAANARWVSLYDALYGTDAIEPPVAGARGFDVARGTKVIAWVRAFLDEIAPLAVGSHKDATTYAIDGDALVVTLADGRRTGLAKAGQLAGWNGDAAEPRAVLLRNHGLHLEIVIDRAHAIGRTDAAGVADVVAEAAITTIQDCEDSVAAVDAGDKVGVYRNWLGLMKGTLEASFAKGSGTVTRRLNDDRRYDAPRGATLTLPGRSLLLVRNVGHHMVTDMVAFDGQPVFETVIDACVTFLIALHDVKG
ncbi:MAG: hypothetical protein RLZZ200_42, partial [Pseudomonadota bacterium]